MQVEGCPTVLSKNPDTRSLFDRQHQHYIIYHYLCDILDENIRTNIAVKINLKIKCYYIVLWLMYSKINILW